MNSSPSQKKICTRCNDEFEISYYINLQTGRETKTCTKCRVGILKSSNNPNTVAYKVRERKKELRANLPPCVLCGDNVAEHKQFDHIDPTTKMCGINRCRTLDELELEVKKCRSLCHKCHIKHSMKVIEEKRVSEGKQISERFMENKTFVNNIKIQIGKCQNPGCKDIFDSDNLSFYEFDHINPEEKFCNVGNLVADSINRIKEEIKKCRMVCAYCHKIWTAEQRKRSIEEHSKLSQPKPVSKKRKLTVSKIKRESLKRVKLTDEDVKSIRKAYVAKSETGLQLAKRFHVGVRHIFCVLANQSHRDPNFIPKPASSAT